MSEKIRIQCSVLEQFAFDLFVAAGLPDEWAKAEAEVLIWADMRGLGSHGVLRIPSYIAWMARGLRRPDANIHIVSEKGATALLEADRAPGLYVMRKATELAIDKARDHGIGWINVRQVTHTGAMGFYVRQAAKAGMIGIATCSSRPLMAYYGTRDAALGTSPIAIAAPRANGEPLVLDMASAAVSIGAMAQARQSGKPLPEGSAVDELGHVTTDPNRAVTPLPIAGPKGAGLGLMIECLTSLVSGYPLLASAYEDPSLGTDFVLNAMVAALDPAAFPFANAFEAEVDRLARDLAKEPRADGFDEILMPGERGDREMTRTAREGITLAPVLWKQLADVAGRLGVAMPETM
ncbi:MAG: Ldh family oxidoreductase [Hyphomicrobiales bacterium]|nr:Ldh family oxidoreductase [Hyphomicrobiales bacterium]